MTLYQCKHGLTFGWWVRVKQHTHFPLAPTYFPLISISASPLSAPMITLACDVTLAWYQQAGSGGKNVGVSGKWVRWFTLTLNIWKNKLCLKVFSPNFVFLVKLFFLQTKCQNLKWLCELQDLSKIVFCHTKKKQNVSREASSEEQWKMP
jgi:hypothetical protein